MITPENHFNEELQRYQEAEVEAELQHDAIAAAAKDQLQAAYADQAVFDSLDDDYEIIDRYQVRRALANLDDAIVGKEYARDAIYTALSIIQAKLKHACTANVRLNGRLTCIFQEVIRCDLLPTAKAGDIQGVTKK